MEGTPSDGAGHLQSSSCAAASPRIGQGSVWTDGGCKAYYTDANGRNFAIYPGFAAGFRRRTRRFDPEAYLLSAR